MSLVPDQATFRQLAQQSDLIPVCLDLMADLETPVSVYARLRALGWKHRITMADGIRDAYAWYLANAAEARR